MYEEKVITLVHSISTWHGFCVLRTLKQYIVEIVFPLIPKLSSLHFKVAQNHSFNLEQYDKLL